jgi:hypothetical protein
VLGPYIAVPVAKDGPMERVAEPTRSGVATVAIPAPCVRWRMPARPALTAEEARLGKSFTTASAELAPRHCYFNRMTTEWAALSAMVWLRLSQSGNRSLSRPGSSNAR